MLIQKSFYCNGNTALGPQNYKQVLMALVKFSAWRSAMYDLTNPNAPPPFFTTHVLEGTVAIRCP